MYIQSWNQLPDGAKVIQDTYSEVYIFCREKDGNYLLEEKSGKKEKIDFSPNCRYDQPWIRID